MSQFTVQEIVRATHGALVTGDLGVSVTGVSIDSRTIAVGEAFFAIRGHRLDGHAFLRGAASRGASCLVVETLVDDLPPTAPVVLVEDTTRALGGLAAFHRNRFSTPLVAVTGSNGKTTTKEMIAGVLGVRGSVLKPTGSFNNQWGLPLTLLRMDGEHHAVVLELGANQPGEIAALAAIAAPTVGVVTTVAAVHTEFFGSLDGVREEKASLVRAIRREGHVLLNADDARVAGMADESAAPVTLYGRSSRARVRALDEVEDDRGVAFTLAVDGGRVLVRLAFAGRHNVTNALAAAAVGVVLGLTAEQIAAGLATARPVKGRCIWRPAGDVLILDDTYNASPVSVRAALDTAVAHRGSRRLVVVLGDMLELGAIAEAGHRDVGEAAVAAGAAELVGVGTLTHHTVEAARHAGLADAYHVATCEDAVTHLLKRLVPGDMVLVKGSRGMRMERVVDALAARLARPEHS